MNVSDAIGSVLKFKGSTVWTIPSEATVFEAIQLMAEKNVGALLVLDGTKPIGVFSERDYARKVALFNRRSRETKVREIMPDELISVTPEHTVEQCMHQMTNHRIRHLPVMSGGTVVGLISIGDLVNWIISAQSQTIDQLQNYITGQYPG